MIFAHGPWYTEWHHFIPWLIIAFPTIGAWVAMWRSMFKRKKIDQSPQDDCDEGHFDCDGTHREGPW